MEEIPDDVFAPSVSEMDGVQPGPRLQQHLWRVNTTLDGKKKYCTWSIQCQVYFTEHFFFIIYGATNIIYIHICIYISIYRQCLVINN